MPVDVDSSAVPGEPKGAITAAGLEGMGSLELMGLYTSVLAGQAPLPEGVERPEYLRELANAKRMLEDREAPRAPEREPVEPDPEGTAALDRRVEQAGGDEPWAASVVSSNGNQRSANLEAKSGGKVNANELLKFADALIREGSLEFFHDSEGHGWATLLPPCLPAVRTLRIESGDFKKRFQALFVNQERASDGRRHRVINTQGWTEAQASFDSMALHDGPCLAVFHRVAALESATLIDFGDDTGGAAEITAECWSIVDEPAVRFRRPRAMRPLPRPVEGASLDLLRSYINVAEEDLPLVLSWLVNAIAGRPPFPILAFYGEQGSAKSTTARFCRQLIDPSLAPLRSFPQHEGDLAVATDNSYVLAFDNLSNIADWGSDALCRIADGAGFSTRTHYTMREEDVFEGARPIVLNGINELPRRPDLLDRSYLVECRPIDEAHRREDSEVRAAFEADRPALLGLLFDGVVSGLARRGSVHLERTPRMVDAARLAVAAEPGLGLAPGTMGAAFERSQQSATAIAIEASPFVEAIIRFLPTKHDHWQGRAGDLLAELNKQRGDEAAPPKGWPATAAGAAGALRRLLPVLRSAGVPAEYLGRQGRDRIWELGEPLPDQTLI